MVFCSDRAQAIAKGIAKGTRWPGSMSSNTDHAMMNTDAVVAQIEAAATLVRSVAKYSTARRARPRMPPRKRIPRYVE